MDELNKLISPETQALILQVIALLTVLLPIAEKVVEKTSNKVDDKIVDTLKTILGLVPRVRLGKGTGAGPSASEVK